MEYNKCMEFEKLKERLKERSRSNKMDTFEISDEEIINCIVDCANNMSGNEQINTIKILVDFMQFKNSFNNKCNIYNNLAEKGEIK